MRDDEPLFDLPDPESNQGRWLRRLFIGLALFFIFSTVLGMVFHLSRLIHPIGHW